jgi:hypothetical protein
MRLPPQVATGDTVKLKFAGRMPQPVFLLDVPEHAPRDTPQLSPTARLLNDIMQQVPARSLPTLTPALPLLDRPPARPAELAIALRTAVVRSGLFYESHLANWAVGLDSLDGLMQEPQNRLAADVARNPPTPPAAAPAPTDPAAAPAGVPGVPEPRPVNPLHALLAQQLQVLESPQFAWQGEVWPGQPMEWRIARQDGHAADQRDAQTEYEAKPSWESHLKLSLPHLGKVEVHIRLDAQQTLSLRMAPERSEVERLLQQNRARLAEQLAAAGCALHAVTVQHDGSA